MGFSFDATNPGLEVTQERAESPGIRAAVEAAVETERRFGSIEAKLDAIGSQVRLTLDGVNRTNGSITELERKHVEHQVVHAREGDLVIRVEEVEGDLSGHLAQHHDTVIATVATKRLWKAQYTWFVGGVAAAGATASAVGGALALLTL